MADSSSDKAVVAAVLATYESRSATLSFDEGSGELGQKNENDEDYNRIKIMQRDLGELSVIASLALVQYGKWAEKDACLLAFRFQFQKGNAQLLRFGETSILLEFQARPPTTPADDPVILNYGPRKLQSEFTVEDRKWHCKATLSAKYSGGGAEVGPELDLGQEGSFSRRYATTVSSDDWGNRHHREPNCVKIWMEEDEKQKDGIPLELLAAVVIQVRGPCQANVKVKVDNPFQMLAWPWTKDQPILLQPNVGYGVAIRQEAPVDFSSMTQEEWRKLVTPDLKPRDLLAASLPAS